MKSWTFIESFIFSDTFNIKVTIIIQHYAWEVRPEQLANHLMTIRVLKYQCLRSVTRYQSEIITMFKLCHIYIEQVTEARTQDHLLTMPTLYLATRSYHQQLFTFNLPLIYFFLNHYNKNYRVRCDI